LQDLPENVDPCGENGEYHSFVFDGPLFNRPVPFQKGEIVYREYKAPATTGGDPADGGSSAGFYFCDIF
jgi:diphthamide synthase (EF-2-diphthine--ammonia ligase)